MTDGNAERGLLVAALIKAQAEIRPIQPNAVNPFLKNSYADLGAHIEGITPALHKHGLAVSQLVFGEGGSIGVETVLLHTSGQSLTSKVSMPVTDEKGKSGAQVAGSIVSYLRRYALAAIVSAYSGDDDDGAAAAKNGKPSDKPAADKPIQWTDSQTSAVIAHIKAADKNSAAAFLAKSGMPNDAASERIESFVKAYLAAQADGLSKDDSMAKAQAGEKGGTN